MPWVNLIWASEAFAYHQEDLRTRWELYGRYTRTMIARGALFNGPDYIQAQRVRSYFKKAVAAVMGEPVFSEEREVLGVAGAEAVALTRLRSASELLPSRPVGGRSCAFALRG